jgi:hypothetical protein
MNFIFGIIVLALFIIAVRVIWATVLQTIAFLKSGLQVLRQRRAQRSARLSALSAPVVMPYLPHPDDWDMMADSLRHEIHQRNTGFRREADRLDAQLQAKLKTMELFKADIQIAKLEQELLKIKPAVVGGYSRSNTAAGAAVTGGVEGRQGIGGYLYWERPPLNTVSCAPDCVSTVRTGLVTIPTSLVVALGQAGNRIANSCWLSLLSWRI